MATTDRRGSTSKIDIVTSILKGGSSDSTPLPYTSSVLQLLYSEIYLIVDIFLHYPLCLPGILAPLWSSNKEDELCLFNPRNVWSLFLHAVLILYQWIFILSSFYFLILPIPASLYLAGIIFGLVFNFFFCKLLNGTGKPQISTTDLTAFEPHDDESWIFINGVSVGRDWFQNNLNTLSLIFRRRIIGVHNITYGIIFDLVECIIQRSACYPTEDIRTGFAQVKQNLLNPKNKKIVLIVHSQGGIEAGAILDWLLDDLPSDLLGKLEIYTFGSAANHFNNPVRSSSDAPGSRDQGVIKHIEHYTNSGDFVSRFGILGFIRLTTPTNPASQTPVSPISTRDRIPPPSHSQRPSKSSSKPTSTRADGNSTPLTPLPPTNTNRFRGRLFKRHARGHLLNQHYLAYMFTRERIVLSDGAGVEERVADTNDFMDSDVMEWDGHVDRDEWGWGWKGSKGKTRKRDRGNVSPRNICMVRDDDVDMALLAPKSSGKGGVNGLSLVDEPRKVKDLSRLWKYRNGGVPDDGE